MVSPEAPSCSGYQDQLSSNSPEKGQGQFMGVLQPLRSKAGSPTLPRLDPVRPSSPLPPASGVGHQHGSRQQPRPEMAAWPLVVTWATDIGHQHKLPLATGTWTQPWSLLAAQARTSWWPPVAAQAAHFTLFLSPQFSLSSLCIHCSTSLSPISPPQQGPDLWVSVTHMAVGGGRPSLFVSYSPDWPGPAFVVRDFLEL